MKKWAVVCNTGLGDAILFERLAHAFLKAGHSAVVYGDYLDKLGSWYSDISFQHYPKDIDDPNSSFWQLYDGYVFQEYASGSHVKASNVWVLGENYREKWQSWKDHQECFLQNVASIRHPELKSSIKPLPGLVFRKNKQQVVIHPTSLKEEKNWPAAKFVELAKRLQTKGYSPIFCVGENDRAIWKKTLDPANLTLCVLSLSNLAALIYESGYFIGNDSGIGHMAPALGIPSLKIFDRTSRALFWSGGWPVAKEVTPWSLPTRSLRVKYWKACLPVSRVEKSFLALVSSCP